MTAPFPLRLPMLLLALLCCAAVVAAAAAPVTLPPAEPVLDDALDKPLDWFKTPEGRELADNLVSWQNNDGGWWKQYDPKIRRPSDLPSPGAAGPGAKDDQEDAWRTSSTFDNGATYSEIRLLARAFTATGDAKYRDAFDRGMKYVFAAQYPSGGWPQRFPLQDNYGRHITLNDKLMAGVMQLLRDVSQGRDEFAFVEPPVRQKAKEAFDRGVECLLKMQIKDPAGRLTAWCQQHDAQTLAPTAGRSYELASIASFESAGIVELLMEIENPAPRIRRAIEDAVDWFQRSKIHGKRYERVSGSHLKYGVDRILKEDPSAPPLWARFYEIDTNKPFFANRDGKKVYSLDQVDEERRAKYAWYGDSGNNVLKKYEKWKKRFGEGPAASAAQTATAAPAAAKVQADAKNADAQVSTVATSGGQFTSVQAAIDSIPAESTRRHVILIKPGTYKGRIEIARDKPPITFRGEDADAAKTVLTNDWNASFVPPAATQPVGTTGSASTTVHADGFHAENVTFENTAGDKGQAVAMKFTGDRGVFRNCRFLGWQDTLYVDGGRAYFVDCYIEGRVDFIFGGSPAVFERCTIHSKNGGYITAARTPPDQEFGYVFLDCTLTGDGAPAYLGRPWQWDRGRKASVAFIRTKMGPHIRPEGWNPWDLKDKKNTNPRQVTRYAEFASTDLNGKPLDLSKRVPWSKQLTEEEAAKFTREAVLGDWRP